MIVDVALRLLYFRDAGSTTSSNQALYFGAVEPDPQFGAGDRELMATKVTCASGSAVACRT